MIFHAMEAETSEEGMTILACPTCDRKLVFDGNGNASVEKQGNFFARHSYYNPTSGITEMKIDS